MNAPSAALRRIARIKAKCRAIHVARRQLQMDDTSYRATLKRAAGVQSSTEINTEAKANAVLDEFSRLGFRHKGRRQGEPHTLDREPYLQKVEALLADMQLPWAYAERIAENITGGKKPESIQRLAWVREPKHLVGLIAALHGEKKKRLDKVTADLGAELARHGLGPEFARQSAEDMGRLLEPWPWHQCLETLHLISDRLAKYVDVKRNA